MFKKFDVAQLYSDCISLVLFRTIRNNIVFAAYEKVLESLKNQDGEKALVCWVEFLAELAKADGQLNFKSYCAAQILQQDNFFTRSCESVTQTVQLVALAQIDLQKLENLASVDLKTIEKTITALREKHELPMVSMLLHETTNDSKKAVKKTIASKKSGSKKMNPQEARFFTIHEKLCKNVGWINLCDDLIDFWKYGVGIFACSVAFVWKNMQLAPAENFNAVPIDSLYGYDLPRAVVLENTMRFVHGHAANNLLLYGDCGTGKSATVKSIAADFALSTDESKNRLRIVEVRKEQLNDFLLIAEQLSKRAFRFIVFIDDLSFNEVDERYIGLKALLEGSLESRPENVVLYATSNRRHLVKEKAADRIGLGSLDRDTEIRAEDAVQEHLSLSERFGMTVIFTSPDQDEYLQVVFGLVRELSIKVDTEFVRENALRWSTWYNGRSPRTAKHFADWLASGKIFPWDLTKK